MDEKKTPLYDRHLQMGGRMVDFGGYALPVQYEGVLREHAAVRTSAGLFDVSHMGEVRVEGPKVFAFVQHLVTNDLTGMSDGQVRYSPMCREDGGTVDDLLVYRQAPDRYLLVVNAANRQKDFAFMKAHNPMRADISDISDGIAQLALQGPAAQAIMSKVADESLLPRDYYTFADDVPVAGIRCLLSRTGYTGEDGYELYCRADDGPALWDALMAAGGSEGICPCGLGARDTLRLEAAMPLYGHELSESITPLEAGLGFFVKLDKDDFIGREALLRQKLEGIPRRRTGIVLTDRGIAREGARVFRNGEEVGVVTSGTQSPTLRKAIAMAMVTPSCRKSGRNVEVEVRGRMLKALTVKLPFYQRPRT